MSQIWVRCPGLAADVAGTLDLQPEDTVDDLRQAFVAQMKTNDFATPHLLVCKTEDDAKLDGSYPLKEFFIDPATSNDGPGQTEDTALLIRYEPPTELDNYRCNFELCSSDGKALEGQLKAGEIIVLKGMVRNQRDATFAPPENKLIVTGGTMDVLKFVFDKLEVYKEFCMGGAAGCGKSCTVRILAAEIRRRKPSARVFYFRQWDTVNHNLFPLMRKSAELGETFVLVDQLINNDHAKDVAVLADNVKLWVIMVASANLEHFQEERVGGQHNKHYFEFPFSGSAADCDRLVRLFPNKTEFEGCSDFKEPSFPKLSEGDLPDPSQVQELYNWTNGHFLSLSEILTEKRTPQELVERYASAMTTYFEKNEIFYVAVVKMFNTKDQRDTTEARIKGHRNKRLDRRFVSENGYVLSPLFLRAMEQSITLGPPPSKIFSAAYTDLFIKNLSEREFAIERECLQDRNLLKTAAILIPDFPARPEITRISYRTFDTILEEANGIQSTARKDGDVRDAQGQFWAIHAISVKWKEPSIDGIQLYFVNQTLYVIGNSITLQTAQQDHQKSLKWIEDLTEINTKLSSPRKQFTVQYILLFTSKQEDGTELRVSPEFLKKHRDLGEINLKVRDISIVASLDADSAGFLKLDASMKNLGCRELTLHVPSSRKRKAAGCGCLKNRCKTRYCVCWKPGGGCSTSCTCSNCENPHGAR